MDALRSCLILAALLLSGCANKSTTDILQADSGQAFSVRYGTIMSHRPVSVRSDSTAAVGSGAFFGGVGAAVISKTNGATLAGFLLGAVAGEALHELAETDNGIEYVIAFGDGTTMIIAQIQRSREPVLAEGTRVIVQFGAKVNRVISAEHLPTELAAPTELKIKPPERPRHRPKSSAPVQEAKNAE